jgi:beta-N-acetylhexosaminidase
MGGIAQGFSSGEACVRALEAGADTLLMPSDPDAAIRAVLAAQQSGRITRQRVQESVVKILSAKEKVGLDRQRFVNVESLGDTINSPEANEKAQEVADRAVTLVRNNGNAIPLAAPAQTCFVTMPISRFGGECRKAGSRAKARSSPRKSAAASLARPSCRWIRPCPGQCSTKRSAASAAAPPSPSPPSPP